MTALLVFTALGCVGVFGWACWNVGLTQGTARCEGNVTLALRLVEEERTEIARRARIEMGCELLEGLVGPDAPRCHPSLQGDPFADVVIDLTDPPATRSKD